MFNYTHYEDKKVDFLQVLSAADLPEGERVFADVGGHPVVLFNLAGKLFALGDVCTHDSGPVGDGEIEDEEIICPRHGARFDVQTGKANSLPAVVDIPAYPVRVVEGMIEIGIPRK